MENPFLSVVSLLRYFYVFLKKENEAPPKKNSTKPIMVTLSLVS